MWLSKITIKYRPATEIDLDFLDWMHTVCMKDHVDRIYPWKPHLFRQTFNPSSIQLILVDDIEVGMLQTEQHNDELYLGNLLILPAFQNRGVGTAVLQDLLNKSSLLNLSIKLQVLKQNPAKRLYERLGFMTVEETDTYYIMKN